KTSDNANLTCILYIYKKQTYHNTIICRLKMIKIIDELLKPRFLFLAPKNEEDIKLTPSQIALRCFIGVITAAWIGFLPFYLFIIYMHENKFFSYDFFVDGVFGLNTFVVVTAILFVFMSLYFYGFILLFKLGIKEQKEKGKNSLRFLTWLAIIISIMTHYVFFEHAMSANKPQLILWFMSISALLCAFFYSIVGHGFKRSIQNWLSPFIFVAASVILPFWNQDITSEAISMGLRNFNIGGGKHVSIIEMGYSEKTNKSQNGLLILLTPKNAYLKTLDDELIITPISDHTEVKIW
ncbi:hypothetical protein QHE53_10910, partial [Aeromonas salmonicida]